MSSRIQRGGTDRADRADRADTTRVRIDRTRIRIPREREFAFDLHPTRADRARIRIDRTRIRIRPAQSTPPVASFSLYSRLRDAPGQEPATVPHWNARAVKARVGRVCWVPVPECRLRRDGLWACTQAKRDAALPEIRQEREPARRRGARAPQRGARARRCASTEGKATWYRRRVLSKPKFG